MEEDSNGITLFVFDWFGSPENGVRWTLSLGWVMVPVGTSMDKGEKKVNAGLATQKR